MAEAQPGTAYPRRDPRLPDTGAGPGSLHADQSGLHPGPVHADQRAGARRSGTGEAGERTERADPGNGRRHPGPGQPARGADARVRRRTRDGGDERAGRLRPEHPRQRPAHPAARSPGRGEGRQLCRLQGGRRHPGARPRRTRQHPHPRPPQGESPHQLLDFLGVTKGGTPHQHTIKRDYATHRSSIGKNKDDEPGSFKEKGGVGAALKNKVSEYTPGMTTPELLGVNFSGGGFGTKDWNGDVVLPNGSYGHMLLVFTAPTGDKDGALLVGIETVAPGARSPVGYHHGIRSTEATANPESVLHGHKPDKIGNTRAELGKMGGQDWHGFLQTIKRDWADKLEAAKDTDQKRKLYEELVGPRE
ncbi:hypothetical protein H4K38_00030 [Streptomyces sp. I3(2020)]|nr:hypothetical protein [Streptomyces sp. I3(2020)]